MLVVPDNLISEIIARAEEEAPKEVCGWLAGKGNRVVRAYPVPNAAENSDHTFRMKPEAQLATVFEIREAGLGLTATYHSHPRTPAEPSARDLALAAYPDSFHIIVSLANGRPKIRCYRITDKGYRPVALLVEHAYRGRGTPRCS